MCGQSIELPVIGTDDVYSLSPSKIIAVGQNYRDHIAESQSIKVQSLSTDAPSEPVLFPKLPSSLIANGEAIMLPAIVNSYAFEEPRTDYEAELAVVIGSECRNVSTDVALDHVLGYTCMNDVSQRNIQNGDRSGWFRGKCFDTFGPVGPALLPKERCANVQELDIVCRLNGEVVQKSNTRHMIFSVAEIISFVSRNFTLCAGDLIVTGTPAGVGQLAPDDVVEVEIPAIGTLRNPVTAGL